MEHRQIPGAAIDLWPPIEEGLHVIMAPAMAERIVQHGAVALRLDIKHGMAGMAPFMLVESGGFATKFGIKQHMQVAMPLHQIEFVGGFEGLYTLG